MPTHSKLLTHKLRSLGRTLVFTELTRRLSIAASVAILLLACLVLCDALFELSMETRRIMLTIAGAIAGGLLLRALLTPISQHRDDEELALITEKQHPEFDSRLISAVQFANGKGSVAGDGEDNPIVRRMIADTEEVAAETDLLDAVDWRYLGRALLVVAVVAGLATIAFFTWNRVTPALVQRAFLQDVAIPRDTQILTTSGDLKIGIGDRIEITATADGVLPEEGILRVEFSSGRKLDYTLTKLDGAAATYCVEIEDVPESFSYQVRINDARDGEFEVRALARPEIESLGASQVYPDYTGIEPSEHQPGDFYLFPGSQITLQLAASKPLAEATLRLIGLDIEIPFDVADNTASFEVPTEGLSGFSITMRDREGMAAKEPAVFRAELLGDEPPQVRITYPTRSDELLTRSARSLIAFEASDRFGIAGVWLNYRVNGADLRSVELELGVADKPQTVVRHQYDWELSKIEPPLKEGDTVEYWISAQDRQRVAPGIGESERLRFRIVSIADKRQDLLRRASDYLGGVGATAEDQERLNQDLGELIKAKAK
ncbi:MAG: hypothetical protein ACR2RV_05005 [Verrucomicrobiales bacterium]